MRQRIYWELFSVVFLSAACNPMDFLHARIAQSGHIPFQNPMAYAKTGTMVGSSPAPLSLVAPPETCFPETVNEVPTRLRFRDDTALPSEARMQSIGFDMNVKLLSGVSNGNGVIKAGAQFKQVQKVELKFEGVHIEYMDAIRLTEFYRQAMPELCKDYLDRYGFIIQAIQAEKMTFKFYNKTEAAIQLSLENLKPIVDLGANLNFSIENGVELVITSPKYLGYQLGKLQRSDGGLSLNRATKVSKGRFVFDSIASFPPVSKLKAAESFGEFDADSGDFLVPLLPSY